MGSLTLSVAAEKIKESLEEQIALTLKRLIEERHLYQSLVAGAGEQAAALAAKVAQPVGGKVRDVEQALTFHQTGLLLKRWYVADPSGTYAYSKENCSLHVPHVKTFCTTCGRIEPFNVVAAIDYLDVQGRGPLTTLPEFKVKGGSVVQNFVLSFLCQGCKLVPEVFLVRRVGTKLTLCGRSPMEHVEAPKFLPANAQHYFSGAIVAHQSGQTLAGLFLLRTFIEQWLRLLGAKHSYADEMLDWYMTTLPADFKAHFPSLRDIYGTLSDAMHKADASAELFDKARGDIETHFDARRLRKLPDPEPPAG